VGKRPRFPDGNDRDEVGSVIVKLCSAGAAALFRPRRRPPSLIGGRLRGRGGTSHMAVVVLVRFLIQLVQFGRYH